MKILKRTNGFGIIFDTENIEQQEVSTLKPSPDQSLSNHHRMTDLSFLAQYFPPKHSIFIRFEESYFYVV